MSMAIRRTVGFTAPILAAYLDSISGACALCYSNLETQLDAKLETWNRELSLQKRPANGF
jgi:hypothetical protein